MMGEALAYDLSRVAYYCEIGAYVALGLVAVICLVVGVIIIIQDDPEYIGYVPLPRRVDSDDEDS